MLNGLGADRNRVAIRQRLSEIRLEAYAEAMRRFSTARLVIVPNRDEIGSVACLERLGPEVGVIVRKAQDANAAGFAHAASAAIGVRPPPAADDRSIASATNSVRNPARAVSSRGSTPRRPCSQRRCWRCPNGGCGRSGVTQPSPPRWLLARLSAPSSLRSQMVPSEP